MKPLNNSFEKITTFNTIYELFLINNYSIELIKKGMKLEILSQKFFFIECLMFINF